MVIMGLNASTPTPSHLTAQDHTVEEAERSTVGVFFPHTVGNRICSQNLDGRKTLILLYKQQRQFLFFSLKK